MSVSLFHFFISFVENVRSKKKKNKHIHSDGIQNIVDEERVANDNIIYPVQQNHHNVIPIESIEQKLKMKIHKQFNRQMLIK